MRRLLVLACRREERRSRVQVRASCALDGLRLGACAISVVVIGACADTSPVETNTTPDSALSLSPSVINMTVGSEGGLIARLTVDGTRRPLTSALWTSLDPKVALVSDGAADSMRFVTAYGAGTARIVASVGSQADTARVFVPVPDSVVAVEPAGIMIFTGAQAGITARLTVDGVSRPIASVLWTAPDSLVASVSAGAADSLAVVTGLQPGTARVVAGVGGSADTVNVTVVAAPDSLVAIEPGRDTTYVGNQTVLTARLVIDGVAQPVALVDWTTPDSLVASVSAGAADSLGVVTGLQPGTACVIAMIGSRADTAIAVVLPIPDTAFAVEPAQDSVSVGSETVLTARLTIDGVPQPVASVAWTSADSLIASVIAGAADTLAVVTGRQVGTARIVGAAAGRSDTSIVTVTPPPQIVPAMSHVTLADTAGGAGPPVAKVSISNGGGGVLRGLSVGSIAYDGNAAGWLEAQLSDSIAPAVLSLQATTGSLLPGSYTAQVPVNGTTATTQSIAVTFDVRWGHVVARVGIAEPALLLGGDTMRLSATAFDSGGAVLPGVPLTWSSANSLVVSVVDSLGGLIQADSASRGPVHVIARHAGGAADTVTVTVVPRTPAELHGIGAGGSHVCALSSTGEAYCWGANAFGQAAGGGYHDRSTPWPVFTSARFVSLELGMNHSCGVTPDGEAYCWGDDQVGQLGDGDGINGKRLLPKIVDGGLSFASVSAGDRHTCGVTTVGAAYCWGSSGYYAFGEGSSHLVSDRPVAVSGGLTFTSVTAGRSFTCGLTPSGHAYCWGLNDRGQLGTGGEGVAQTPTPVAGGLTFRSLSAGVEHTCGVTTAGAAYCWGSNEFGQLGDGSSNVDRATPVPVAGGQLYSSVGAMWVHSCGLTIAGAAHCWGSQARGLLGNGEASDTLTSSRPVSVLGGLTFTELSVGGSTCGVTPVKDVYCWGGHLALGNGTTAIAEAPQAVLGGLSFATLDASDSNTCGLTKTGQGYCWGMGHYGKNGDGTLLDRNAPVSVSGGLTFAALAAHGGDHACGLTPLREAYCWGLNDRGQLGIGSTGNQTTPVRVSGELEFVAITVGRGHTCGLIASGAAYCWGANDDGQLGDGTTLDRFAPVPVSGGLTLTTIEAGGEHTCGLDTSGAAHCWGANHKAQLGDNGYTDRNVPGPVFGGLSFTSLSAGGWHNCAVAALTSPTVYCWGNNESGQVGDGGLFVWHPTPFPAGIGVVSFVSVSAGFHHTCAVTAAGQVYCWGDGDLHDFEPHEWSPQPFPTSQVFSRLSTGFRFTCGLKSGGEAMCWGGRGHGHLGNGTALYSAVPVRALMP